MHYFEAADRNIKRIVTYSTLRLRTASTRRRGLGLGGAPGRSSLDEVGDGIPETHFGIEPPRSEMSIGFQVGCCVAVGVGLTLCECEGN